MYIEGEREKTEATRSKSFPARILILGAVVVSVLSGALSTFALFASLEQRPAASGSRDFILLYSDAQSGVTNLELEVGDPIELGQTQETVNIVIRATVGDAATRTRLLVSPGLKDGLQNCAGVETRVDVLTADLDASMSDAVQLVRETLPRRDALPPSPSPASSEGSPSDQSFAVMELHFEPADDFVHDYQLRSKAYPASQAVVSCSIDAAEIVRSGFPTGIGTGIETVLVEAPNLAVRMAGGDDDSLARAAYDVRIGDAVDWVVRKTTFGTIAKQNNEGDDVRWSATGEYWSRFGNEPLGVLQPGGQAILERADAGVKRAIIRLSAGFGAALSIGLFVTAARRIITLVATRAQEK